MLPGMLNDQKRIAALILGEVGKDKEKKETESVDQVGLTAATEEIMSAVKTNSLVDLREALKTFISLCGQQHEAEEIGEENSLITDTEME